MQRAGAPDIFQFAPQLCHTVADQSPVGLDLGLAGAAEKTEAASLPLQMRPTTHQPTGLVIQMREFHLKTTFRRSGPLAEDFENETGPVDHLDANLVFQVPLLDGTQLRIDDQQFCFTVSDNLRDLFHLPAAQKGCGARCTNAISVRRNDIQTNRKRKPPSLLQPRGNVKAAIPVDLRKDQNRTSTARKFIFAVEREAAQSSSSSVRL